MCGRSAIAKTIQATPGVPVIAETTWYFVNCTTSAGLGSYSIHTAPMHGTVTTADVSGPLPGCPAGSPPLPAVQSYYTWTDLSTTATTDFFELYYMLNGQVAAVLDVNVILSGSGGGGTCPSANGAAQGKALQLKGIPNGTFITTNTRDLSSLTSNATPADSTCTPPPPPSATIFANGIDITGTTSENPMIVVIGEQIALTSSILNANGATVQSQLWTVPDTLYQSYGYSGLGQSIVTVPDKQKTEDAITFHWIDAVNSCSMQTVNNESVCLRSVAYSATLSDGTTVSAQGTLEVLQPTAADPSKPLLTAVIGEPYVIDFFGPELILFNPHEFQEGFVATPNVDAPPGFTGYTDLVQVTSTEDVETFPSGNVLTCKIPFSTGFDAYWQPNVAEADSPRLNLPDTLTHNKHTGLFHTYLFWKPNLPNAILVPLGELDWSWSASTQRISQFRFFHRWVLLPGWSTNVGAFQPETSYPPNWTNYVTNNPNVAALYQCSRTP